MSDDGNRAYTVPSHVDAENSFGAGPGSNSTGTVSLSRENWVLVSTGLR